MKNKILNLLKTKEMTIPALCQELKVSNEYALMRSLAKLEDEGKVKLIGFDPIYREDGSVIYLAKYKALESEQK